MADFKTQIDNLTGFGSTDDVALGDWLLAGARQVIDVLPMSKLDRMSEIQEFTNFQGVEDSKILHVLRKDENNSNVLMPCREIHASQSGRAADSNYMEFATSSDPAYYLENKRVHTLPASASSNDSKLIKINEDFTITITSDTIDNFPKEATNAVVLYASRNAIMQLMNAKHTNTDITTALTAINTEMDETQAISDLINTQVDAAVTEIGEMATNVDTNVDTALTAMKTAADKINTAIGLANDEYDEVAVEVTGTATSPISAARSAAVSALSISDLDLSGISAPTVSISTVSYSDATNADASSTAVAAITVGSVNKSDISGNQPSYTKPSISLTSNLSITDLSISSSAPSAPSLGTVSYSAATNADASASSVSPITVDSVTKADISGDVPTYTKPTQTFDITQFETFLETDEDTELAQLQLGRLNNELGEYQADIQNELNEFNKENARYKANVEAELAKHNSDLRKAITQAEINARDAQQEAAQTTDVDKFNKAQDQTLALQNAIQTMQATIANNDDLVAKFLQEVNLYQQKVNAEVAEYRLNYEKDFAIFAKQRDTELQQYSLDIQNELNEFNKENEIYKANIQAEIQKHNSDLQKALTQAQLDAADAQQEARQATQVDLANKAQDQALALQNEIQTLQASIANNDDILSKFNQEIGLFQQNINKNVSEYSQNLQQQIAEYQSAIAIQQSYYQEAQARINAGNAYLAEAQSRVNEVNTYGAEVASRLGQVNTQGSVAAAYIRAAQGYATEIQSKIGIVQGYGTEINLRLAVDTTEYTWYERQYAQLDAQFKEALQLISVDKIESETIKDGRGAR